MAANPFNIRLGLGELFSGITQQVLAQAGPAIRAAVERIADATAQQWRREVSNARLWSYEKGQYNASINWSMIAPLTAEIRADYKYAQEIEEGRPSRDLKRMLQTSVKTRSNKLGQKYLIIPFRHNTPGNDAHSDAMPAEIYAQAKTMMPSLVIGQTLRNSASGAWDMKTRRPLMIPKAQYKWGDTLPAGLAPKMQPHHKTDRYAGMVKMDSSTTKARSSSYLTFRVMSEGSSGWIVPPKAGLHLVPKVVSTIEPKANAVMAEAIRRAMQV